MLYTDDQSVNHLALVTNRHVVSGYTSAKINLVDSDGNRNPLDTEHLTIELPDLQKNCVYHSDKDIEFFMQDQH